MKKLIALLLVLVMVMSMTACKKKTEEPAPAAETIAEAPAEEAAVEEVLAEEVAAEEAPVEEPAAEEAPAEEPAAEEAPAEEPAAEEAPAEEPAVEETPAEKVVVEEAAAEEPAKQVYNIYVWNDMFRDFFDKYYEAPEGIEFNWFSSDAARSTTPGDNNVTLPSVDAIIEYVKGVTSVEELAAKLQGLAKTEFGLDLSISSVATHLYEYLTEKFPGVDLAAYAGQILGK